MADVHSHAIRSKNMRAIRNQDTAIEQRIALILKDRGFSYRVQDKALPGRPDFVLPPQKAIIFVHGCFWHRHHCYLFKMPATRTEFWKGKINSNVERDQRYVQQLQEAGWKVLIVWECALRGRLRLEDGDLIERLEEGLLAASHSTEMDHQGLHHYRAAP